MTYGEAIEFLYGLSRFGTKLGLENTFRLAALCANPHERLQFIHVAGTNGKGSTCAMLESIYRHAGWRVGFFTSPHLISFTERIQIDREPISEAGVVASVEHWQAALERANREPDERGPLKPTFFELVTVMALKHFAEAGCGLVIWETGLGGRLDATNIVTPLASVITNIQFDHERWLGHTLEQIAAEKAGIIKPGRPVVTGTTDPSALGVIRRTARERSAPLVVVTSADLEDTLLAKAHVGLPGAHQRWNAAVALATVRMLGRELPVSDATILDGFAAVRWAGRLQIARVGATRVLLDGAHNPAGAAALAAALQQELHGSPATLVIGLFGDKDWRGMCDMLLPQAARVILVPVQSERTVNPEEVRAYGDQRFPGKNLQTCASLSQGLDLALVDPFVAVTGSLHLVGEALELLGLGTGASGERDLNAWDADRSGVNDIGR
jgi:dihydrofolate synthase / folylpolyglutamate synthase